MVQQQIEFYVTKGEQQLGPWSVQEMAARLAAGEIAVTDFVFDDGQNDWVALFQCAALQAHLNSQKPKSAPPKKAEHKAAPANESVAQVITSAPAPQTTPVAAAPSTKSKDEAQEWFVQKGQHRYGPFTYLGVVRAMQEKTVYEFDLCFKEGMSEWVRIADHADFHVDKIKVLSDLTENVPGVFTQRQHPRVRFESEVLVHDNRSVWLGRAFEGSAGGSGLVIENATLVPGQTVLLHFAEREDLPAFNALCEIVGKKFAKDVRDPKSPVQYSVRFVKLDAQAEARVQNYFTNQKPNNVTQNAA